MFRYLKNENMSGKFSPESPYLFFANNSNNLNNRLKSDRRGLLIQDDNKYSQGQVVFRRTPPRVDENLEKPQLRK